MFKLWPRKMCLMSISFNVLTYKRKVIKKWVRTYQLKMYKERKVMLEGLYF